MRWVNSSQVWGVNVMAMAAATVDDAMCLKCSDAIMRGGVGATFPTLPACDAQIQVLRKYSEIFQRRQFLQLTIVSIVQ